MLFCCEQAFHSAVDAFERVFRHRLSTDTLEKISQRMGAAADGNAGFFTRNFTGFDVSTPRCLRWVRKSLNSAELVHACGA